MTNSMILCESETGTQEISVSMFFFHSKARKFFGTTWNHIIQIETGKVKSNPRTLDDGVDMNKSLFWHSKVSGSGNYVVVEFQYTRSKCSLTEGCGFALIPLANDGQTSLKLSVYEGTPRKLLYLPLGMITYESIDAYLPKINSKLYITITNSVSQTSELSKYTLENRILSVEEKIGGLYVNADSNGSLCVEVHDGSCYDSILNKVRFTWSQRAQYENTLLDAIDREYCGEAEAQSKCRKSSFLGNMRQKRQSLSSKSKIVGRYLRIIVHNTTMPLFSKSLGLMVRNNELVPCSERTQLPCFLDEDIAYVFSLDYKIALPKGKYESSEDLDFHVAGQIHLPFSRDIHNDRQNSISLVQNRYIYSMFDRNRNVPFESTYLGGSTGSLVLKFNLISEMNGNSTELHVYKEMSGSAFDSNENDSDSFSRINNLSSDLPTSNLNLSRVDVDTDDHSVSSNVSHVLETNDLHREEGTQEQKDTLQDISYGKLLIDIIPDLKTLVVDMQMYMRSGDIRWLDSASRNYPKDKCLSILKQMETYEGRFRNEMLESIIVNAIRKDHKRDFIARMMRCTDIA